MPLMTPLITILGLMMFTASAPAKVRVSLFSLFKPQAIYVRVLGEGATLDTGGADPRLIARGEQLRIRLAGNSLSVAAGMNAGASHLIASREIRIIPEGSGALDLEIPGRIRRAVRGGISMDASERGHLRILLTTDRESVVASVVAAEINRREPEALKALAVVVRTYMMSHAARHSADRFDFCDTTHCQLYRGEQDLSGEAALRLITKAVEATTGQTLTFKGNWIEAYYTANCGGLSATPSMVWGGATLYPYSRVRCVWCVGSRFFKWQRSTNAARILDSLSAATGLKLSRAASLTIDRDQTSGFVRSIVVRDADRSAVLSADAFRRAIGQRLGWNTVLSPTFTVERRGSLFVFRGRGFGSQVGLCEAGAVALAADGRGYREILGFYYPGAEVRERNYNE